MIDQVNARFRTSFVWWNWTLLFAAPLACAVDRAGMVVCVEPYAAKVGAGVLRDGGNAVDAAIATAFALAVTHPEAGNVGGGGFMLVRMHSGETFCVDYREKAPALATPTMFLGPDGKPDKSKVDIGWLTVGVPGTPHGLWTAHKQAGKLPWKRLVDPAVRLARDGFRVDRYLHRGLARQEKVFGRMVEPAAVYLVAGKAPDIGATLKLPDLAATLERIAEKGPDGFYSGKTADLLEQAMLANGGLVRKSDLAAYRARVREPVRGRYRGFEIISAPPPSSGGVAIIEMLNILEPFELAKLGHNSVASIHLMAEAMRRAYLDRARYLGDPDFAKVPIDMLISKGHSSPMSNGIDRRRASRSIDIGKDIVTPSEPASEQTTHFSVIDKDGNAVANTYTLEDSYGARVIAPGTGFLLNNEMHDFNVWPGHTTPAGYIGTEANRIAPGKRMLSSMTPTIVAKDGAARLITGSPGGRTIPNTVLQVVLNVCEFGMEAQPAVDAARIHHQWLPDVLSLENKLPQDTARRLEAMGHKIGRRSQQGDAHSIVIDPKSLRPTAGTDARLRGAAELAR